ncbi:MAG: 2Fe-2S iron-sulfur cluster-binding protein [Gloeomargarita sp. SKYBB_i_bin120]|nr:2Fe-2S iron-sulfur cluster-binding protein [Gloeomargarita sp. SKYG98]MCS7291986.1 2Fe-2S iron-sulfur cluster-binding protein [Gloeomargarita sp. SKYB120]MDW8177546.1 2Fe-2S iron-sulfur cluster-binding protein [Gloeomargarita sp. SKYBB_i_bin120]
MEGESGQGGMTVEVRFLPDGVTVTATPGESLLSVAQRAGVVIPTGCLMGACHACVVDWESPTTELETVQACLTSIPAGVTHLTVYLDQDPTW